MMNKGIQLIGLHALVKLLHDAGREMEPELQFAKVSPTEFISRIEYRSSLLIQTGYQKIDGVLQPVFEFRHLTFQEYLAARGFTTEQYPGRNSDKPLSEILQPHIDHERWQEVIPLACVMAGRKAEPFIKLLISLCEKIARDQEPEIPIRLPRPVSVLGRCLAEGVLLTPTTLKSALLTIGNKTRDSLRLSVLEPLMKGKFGSTFKAVIEDVYFSGTGDWSSYDKALSEIFRIEKVKTHSSLLDAELVSEVCHLLINGTRKEKVYATLLAMQMAFSCRDDQSTATKVLRVNATKFRDAFCEMVLSGDLPSIQAACWALAWFGNAAVWQEPLPVDVMITLYGYWSKGGTTELARKAAWAFSTQPLFPRGSISLSSWGDCDEWLKQQLYLKMPQFSEAAVVVAWYRQSPWTDDELVGIIQKHCRIRKSSHSIPKALLSQLGDSGQAILVQLNSPKAS